jgi:hypothetical protein
MAAIDPIASRKFDELHFGKDSGNPAAVTWASVSHNLPKAFNEPLFSRAQVSSTPT